MRTTPTNRPHPFRSLGRAVSWHRRKLAVVAAIAAVLSGIAAANPEDPPTVRVLRSTTQLAGGRVLTDADVEVAEVTAGDVPAGALVDPDEVVGQVVAGPVADGQIMTALTLVSQRSALPRGRVIAPMRLADADLAALLRPGERVDVVVAERDSEKAAVIAEGVRVVTVPAVPEPDQQSQSGALVLVEVDLEAATLLARAAVSGTLTVLWR